MKSWLWRIKITVIEHKNRYTTINFIFRAETASINPGYMDGALMQQSTLPLNFKKLANEYRFF
jgi:hypothetical protein